MTLFGGLRWGWGVLVALLVLLAAANLGGVEGADGIYVFGDSYLDTGNSPWLTDRYGSTWPGYPDNRWSDGRNQADYFAKLFELPTPVPSLHIQSHEQALRGVNFARSGAGVTYAWGVTPLDAQVDEMEALVTDGLLPKHHLEKSVAVMNIGINDYDTRNLGLPLQESEHGVKELTTFTTTVVDGIAMAIVRLHQLGVRNIVVSNIPPMACIPLATMELDFTACSSNSTILAQTSLHNELLRKRVQVLNEDLKGLHVVIADQTKAFQALFADGAKYGFEDPLTPCCHGSGENLYKLVCGSNDSEGKPLYTECKDPGKAVLFDLVHPTDAAWKAVINLYANVEGYTLEGPKLRTWIHKYNV